MKEKKNKYSLYRAIVFFACSLVFIVSLFSCNSDDDGIIKHPGKLSLSLKADTTSLNASIKTKSLSDEFADFIDANNYSVDILKGENVIQHFKRYDEMPESVVLEEGAYVLKAYRGKNEPYAFLSPYFEGSTDFTIKEGMSTPLDITCSLANARVTVEYSDDFKEAYPSYSLLMNTEFMQDSLTYAQAEIRPAYLQTGSEGTDLKLLLRYVKIEEMEMRELTPDPIAIEPQQRVHLLFKTDGEALSGVGLVVTLNNSLDGDSTLNVTIPDYTYKPVTAPTLTPANFESGIDLTLTYTDLSNKAQSYSIAYVVPATVGNCWLTMKKTIGDKTETTSLDLAKATDLSTAKSLGFEIKSGENELSSVHKTKTGTIYFDEVLARLVPQKVDAHYEYTLQVADTLPIPAKSEIITLSVKPEKISSSSYESTFADASYDIVDGNDIPQTERVIFKASSGFKTAELKVQMKQGATETTTIYDFVEDVLPRGIAFDKKTNVLTFDKNFVRYLPIVIGSREDAQYILTVNAVDRMDDIITPEPLKLNVKITPVIELVVPSGDAWAWKAKLELTLSGLSSIKNPSDLKFYVSKDGNSYVELENYNSNINQATTWAKGLDINLEKIYVKAQYKDIILFSDQIIKEKAEKIEYGDMNTWYLDRITCKYNKPLSKSNSYIPFSYLNTSKGDGVWKTNNSVTAGKSYEKTVSISGNSEDAIPQGCFPTVYYLKRDDGFAAVIRSIDASQGNSKARGELRYSNILSSRPSSVSFEYTYDSQNRESFVTEIIIKDDMGIIIATSENVLTSETIEDFTSLTIPIVYTKTKAEIKSIELLFASSNKTEASVYTGAVGQIDIPRAENSDLGAVTNTATFRSLGGVRYGSTLKIDNVTLNYREE